MAVEAKPEFEDVTNQYLAGEPIKPKPGYILYVDYVHGPIEGYVTADGRRFQSLHDIPTVIRAEPIRSLQQRARLIPFQEPQG